MIDTFEKILSEHKKFSFFYFFFSYLCIHLFFLGNASVEADNGPVFSIGLKDASINSCLEKISILSGYEIFVTGETFDDKISIELNDVTIEKSLARILRGINHIAQWDDNHKRVTLVLYGRQGNDYQSKKFKGTSPLGKASIGESPLLKIKPDTKEADPGPIRLKPQISNGFPPESSTKNNGDNFPFKNMKLKASGVNTSFVQGTPTGSFDP